MYAAQNSPASSANASPDSGMPLEVSAPSSTTPDAASSAHAPSVQRRVCTSASSSGPTNSTVTATPSGTVRRER
jgi:hypothetical protein